MCTASALLGSARGFSPAEGPRSLPSPVGTMARGRAQAPRWAQEVLSAPCYCCLHPCSSCSPGHMVHSAVFGPSCPHFRGEQQQRVLPGTSGQPRQQDGAASVTTISKSGELLGASATFEALPALL